MSSTVVQTDGLHWCRVEVGGAARTVGRTRAAGRRLHLPSRWTNTGEVRERGSLKHRAQGETRVVPVHPELVALLLAR